MEMSVVIARFLEIRDMITTYGSGTPETVYDRCISYGMSDNDIANFLVNHTSIQLEKYLETLERNKV